jgi:autotransporter-associated beta strand protein
MKTKVLENSTTATFDWPAKIGARLFAALSLTLTTFAVNAANINWQGGTASYNTPADWVGGAVPGLPDSAINDNGSNNVVQINIGDPDWDISQIVAGDGAGDGAFVQNGQNIYVTGTNYNDSFVTPYYTPFRMGVAVGKTGVYTLNGGTINYTNGGSFDVGELGAGILNINGGSIAGNGNFADNLGVSATPTAVTATVGGGLSESDYTWFEQGVYSTAPGDGLPSPGTTITSSSLADHIYTLPSSYAGNDAVMISSNTPNATITLTSPMVCSNLSLLGCAGNGPVVVNYTVHHADNSIETGSLSVPDWFGPAANTNMEVLGGVGARVDALGATFEKLGSANGLTGSAPYLFSLDMALTNFSSAVDSVDLAYVSSSSAVSATCLLGISGQSAGGGNYVPLDMMGYNEDMIIGSGEVVQVANTVTDVVNQVSGAIQVSGSGQMFVGNYGTAIYNLSGGSIDVHDTIAIGRNGGSGTFNMTGGVFNQDGGGNLLVGTDNNAPAGSSSVGVLNQSGGTITSQGQFLCPEESPATGTYNLSGTGALVVSNWIAFGRTGGAGVLNMNGGSITKLGDNTTHFDIGASGAGTVNQTNGTITSLVSHVWIGEAAAGTWNMEGGAAYLGVVNISQTGTGSGTLNLDGGLFQVTGIITGNSLAISTLNFNGGTLQASSNNVSFLSGLTEALVGNGGAVIDSQGYNITIAQALENNGSGGLIKNGTGALTLTGANSYTGDTVVNAGSVFTTTESSTRGNVTVADNASFGVTVLSAGAQYSAANVTLGNLAGATLNFDLGAFGNPAVGQAPLNASGTLTVAGTIVVNVADAMAQLGEFPLVQYGLLAGAGHFTVGSLPAGVAGHLVTNTANSSIDLVITGINQPRWDGEAGGTWDTGSDTNWVNISSDLPTTYTDPSPVVFDDSALGVTTVNLTTTVSPAEVTFNNNALAYTIVGSGKISGSTTGMSLNGTNIVAILNTGGNNFGSAVVINGGVLTVTNLANGGLPSAIGASSANATNLVLAGGALDYEGSPVTINRSYSMTASSSITNNGNLTLTGLAQATAGTFTKSGSGTLDYAGAGTNVLSVAAGAWSSVVQGGTLVLDGTAGGQTNTVGAEMNVGSGTTNGLATGMAGNLILSNATLNCATWFAISRGNCTNGLTSTVTLYNSTLNSPSGVSLGYANGLAHYSANPVLNLLGNSQVNAGVNNINICETANGGANAIVNVMGGSSLIAGTIYVGADTSRGVLSFNSTGTTAIGNNSGGLFRVGGNALVGDTGAGAINLSAGTLVSGSNNVYLAAGVGGTNCYGSVNVSGGNFARPTYGIRMGRGGFASFAQSGGTVTIGAEFSLASNPSITGVGGDPAVATFTGGTATVASGFRVPEGGTGYSATLNIGTEAGGNASVVSPFATAGVQLNYASGGNGTLNLDSGTLEVSAPVTKAVAAGMATVNLNGGTLQAGSNNVTLMDTTFTGASSNSVNVFKGGVTIDSQTNTATLAAKLLGTVGSGVYPAGGLITVPGNGGAGYLGAPIVTNATSGAGTGLQAVATVVNGVVTNVIITCPGQNYAAGDTVTFGFESGGFTNLASAYAYTLKAGDVAGNAGGGLTKIGSGTLYVTGTNTYTGTSTVNAGTLVCVGPVAGPVTVASGGTLAVGSPLTSFGTNTIAGALTLSAGGTNLMKINATSGAKDMLTGMSQVTYGGTLVITNLGGPLAGGASFKLFAAGSFSGAFSAIVPATPGSGLAWNTDELTSSGTLQVVTAVRSHPKFTGLTAIGGSLVLSGTNATGSYVLYGSTNLTLPLMDWTPVFTNTFSGPFSFTNAMNSPQMFYLLQ